MAESVLTDVVQAKEPTKLLVDQSGQLEALLGQQRRSTIYITCLDARSRTKRDFLFSFFLSRCTYKCIRQCGTSLRFCFLKRGTKLGLYHIIIRDREKERKDVGQAYLVPCLVLPCGWITTDRTRHKENVSEEGLVLLVV